MDVKQVFTPEVIDYYKSHKNEITRELLDQLRSSGNEGKQIALDILDTELSDDNFYLDAYGKKIFFMGDRNLKKAYTSMKLDPIHVEEIKKCSEDLNYFMDNYIKIRTKKGYDFPELREYQQKFIKVLNSDNESILAMLGRQCVTEDTVITTERGNITIKELFSESCRIPPLNHEFTDSGTVDARVLTPLGFKKIEFIHKTKPFKKYLIRTENGLALECGEKHAVIADNGDEVYARDCLHRTVRTVYGNSKVVECTDCNCSEAMYDISIKEGTELYYSNGILSHNSGKSVTVAIFLVWHFNFNHKLNAGICANLRALAMEFLNNIKEMFYTIPMWMRQGVTAWTKTSIESELKMRILTSAPGADAFRGFSISLLVMDETAWLPSNLFYETIDSIIPSQSAMSWKKNIFISTPHGMNHFYDLVEGARKRKVLYGLTEEQIAKLPSKVLSTRDAGNGVFDVTVDEPSNDYALFEMDWRDVPRYNSKGKRLTPEEFRDQVVTKSGVIFFNQNFACEFLGSTLTLISSDSIKRFKPKEPEMVLARKLNIFEEPKPKHKYIMGVDPAKYGSDSFSIQVIDITTFPFVEVAAAKLPDENFQTMPSYLYDWAKWYNEAFLIIENNDGAGTYANTVLHTDYEYENLYFQKTFNTYKNESKTKIEPGFRTNVKNRALILDTLKLLIDNQKLIINDINTIKEFNTFVLKNNKFQADDGFHDDMIMALCIALAPFADAKNFDNIKELTDKMYSSDSSETDFTDFLCIGSFDDGSDSSADDTLGYFGDEPDTGGKLTLEEKREILREIDANRKLR